MQEPQPSLMDSVIRSILRDAGHDETTPITDDYVWPGYWTGELKGREN